MNHHSRTIHRYLYRSALGMIFILSACQNQNQLAYNQGMKTSATLAAAPSSRLRAEKPKPNGHYSGPIRLTIGTGLKDQQKTAVMSNRQFSAKSTQNVQTQDLIVGPEIWHSDILTRTTGQPDEFDLTFTVPKKGTYFIRIYSGDSEAEHRVSSAWVELNGAQISTPEDYNQQVALVEKTVDITNSGNQQVHVRLASKPGSFLWLEVLESVDPLEPVFDPADPSSLGELFPNVPGNKNIPIPETFSALVSLNGHPAEPITTGQILVQVAEPVQANIDALTAQLGTQVVTNPIPGWYLLQPDMTQVDVTALEGNLRTLNSMATDPDAVIKTGSFGNLESAKTFAFAVAMAVDPRVASVGFNPVLEFSSAVTTQEQPIESHQFSKPIIPSAQNSWWLNERSTWTTHAWKYTQGYSQQLQRSIKVAVIDAGFSGLNYHSQPGRDMDGQVLWLEGGVIQMAPNRADSQQLLPWSVFEREREDSLVPPDLKRFSDPFTLPNNVEIPSFLSHIHGTEVAGAIAARSNNGIGIAGVAPQAKVIPYKIGYGQLTIPFDQAKKPTLSRVTTWEAILSAIQYAGSKADIINMSLNRKGTDAYLYNYFDTVVNQLSWVYPMKTEITRLSTQNKVVFVNSAGNFGWDAELAIPGTKLFPELITVGALRDNKPVETPALSSDADNLTRVANTGDVSTSIEYGSNFGPYVTLWAPGEDMLSLSPEYKEALITSDGSTTELTQPSTLFRWEATSAAAPVVSGIVALMKAVDPNLTAYDIKQRLLSTSRTNTYVDNYLRTNPVYTGQEVPGSECEVLGKPISCGNQYSGTLTLKTVNALNAVQSLTSQSAQTLPGVLTPVGSATAGTFRLENASQGYGYNLKAGESSDLSSYEVEYLDPATGALQYLKFAELRQRYYPGAPTVELQGWPNPNTGEMQLLKMKWIPTPNPEPTPTPNPTPTATPTPVPTATPKAPTDKQWFVRAFNVNDRVNIIVNGIYYAVQNQRVNDPVIKVEITPLLQPYPAINTVQFQVFNDDNTSSPGTSWGFELWNSYNGTSMIYKDVRGRAGQFGARRGDLSMGLVYDQTIAFHKNGIVPGTGTPYDLLTYNISDVLTIKKMWPAPLAIMTHTANDPGSISTTLSLPDQLNEYPSLNQHRFEITNNNGNNYTWGTEIWSSNYLVYRNRDGEKENLTLSGSQTGALFNHTTAPSDTPMTFDSYTTLPVYSSLTNNPDIFNGWMFWVSP